MKICCIGEAMVELSPEPNLKSAKIGVAGDALNTAIYVKRGIGDEGDVHFVSAVGTDFFSNHIVEFAKGHGVDCTGVARNSERGPGLYAIQIDETGERSFTYWRSTSAARVMFGQDQAPDFSALEGADVILVTAITVAILSPAIRAALLAHLDGLRAKGARVAFDSNYRPKLWEDQATARDWMERYWRISDIAFPSIDDEMALCDQTADEVIARFHGYAHPVCVMKRGGEGPVILTPAAAPAPQGCGPADSVVDTTGAGDSFNGGFLGNFLRTGDVTKAAEAAHKLASRVIGVKGAIL